MILAPGPDRTGSFDCVPSSGEMGALDPVGRRLDRPPVGEDRLVGPAEPGEELGARRVEEMVAVEIDIAQRGQTGSGPAQLRHGDGAVQRDHGIGPRDQQHVVEGDDLGPVGRLGDLGVGVDRRDRGLDPVLPGPIVVEEAAHQCVTLPDLRPIPEPAVLIGESNEGSVGCGARRATRLGEQHQGEQPDRLGLLGQQRDQQTTESDRFGRQLGAGEIVAVAGRMPSAKMRYRTASTDPRRAGKSVGGGMT